MLNCTEVRTEPTPRVEQSASSQLQNRFDVIDTEIKDFRTKLSRLYDALEAGKLELFSPDFV